MRRGSQRTHAFPAPGTGSPAPVRSLSYVTLGAGALMPDQHDTPDAQDGTPACLCSIVAAFTPGLTHLRCVPAIKFPCILFVCPLSL